MMLREGERTEKVSIQRQPDHGDFEADGVRCAGGGFMPRTRYEQWPALLIWSG